MFLKKLIALALTLVMIVSVMPVVFADASNDTPVAGVSIKDPTVVYAGGYSI